MGLELYTKWFKDSIPLTFAPSPLKKDVLPHSHDFFELVIFQQGGAIHTVYKGENENSYPVIPGDCFIILPNEKHSYKIGNSVLYYNFLFSESILEGIDELRRLPGWDSFFAMPDPFKRPKIHLDLETRSWINLCSQHLAQELSQKNSGYKLAAKSLFIQILLVLLRNKPVMIDPQTKILPDEAMLAVIGNMEQSLEKKITLAELAKNAHMSVSSFSHKFRLIMGISPGEYLLNLRLAKAAKSLKETNASVMQIASCCGFYDANYLIKSFVQRYGKTPGKYRTDYLKMSELK